MPRRRRPKSPVRGLSIMHGPHPDSPRRWYWRLRRTLDGRLHTLWTGWATVAEAEAAAHDALAHPRKDEPPRARPETVAQLLRLWGREQRDSEQLRPRTKSAYRGAVCRLKTAFGDVRLDLLNVRTLERYRDRYAPKTVKLDLQVLGQAWRWGNERGFVQGPAPTVHVKARPVKSRPTPSPGDVAAVLSHLDGWPALAVKLLHATGARLGEIATLTWDMVDLEEGWVTLNEKTGPRRVPIGHLPDLLAELREQHAQRQADSLQFVLGVRPGTPRRQLYLRLAKACEMAEVGRFTAHGLRRLASTTLLESGTPALTYEALMGHSYRVARDDYARARDEALQAAAAAASLGKLPRGRLARFPKTNGG